MTKYEIKDNINIRPTIKGMGLGANFAFTLSSLSFLAAHPNGATILLTLFPALVSVFFYNRLKEQNKINDNIIKKYKLKDLKDIPTYAILNGVTEIQTLIFLSDLPSNKNILNIIVTMLSGGMAIYSFCKLIDNIKYNAKIIDKTK